MGILGDIWGGIKDIGGGIGSVLEATLPTAIPAGLQYWANRESLNAQRDIAKAVAGQGGQFRAQQRLQQANGGRPMKMTGRQAKGILAQLGIAQTPPYQQPAETGIVSDEIIRRGIEGAGRWLFPGNGNGGAVMVPQPTYCPTTVGGGTVIADDWSDLFSESGNLRGVVAVMQPTGKLTFARNVGQPVIFSRDATLCKRVRSKSAKVAHAAGHRHTYRKR